MHKKGLLFFSLFLSTLTGCMVGPDFHTPASPQTKTYTETPQPKKTISTAHVGSSGRAQYFISGQDIPYEWWKLFHSAELDGLIRQGLTNSPNLDAAEAALRQAEETLTAQIGSSLFPALSAQLGGQRQHESPLSSSTGAGQSTSGIFNLYNATLAVTYTLDVFGGARRAIEGLRDKVDYQRYLWEAAYLTLTSNIATTAITAASLRAQIVATNELIQSQQQQLKIIETQFHVGGVSRANILTQQSLLEQTRATLPPLEQSLAVANHALSVLVGELPSEDHLPNFTLRHFTLPSKLPISIPSMLVRQRPDVRASEALLAAASAQIGVATANMYPQINLTGNYGWENTSPGNLFNVKNSVWNFGGTLTQSIFNAGSLVAQKRAAVAAYDQAAAQYRQTVLTAFQNVADALRALEHDAKTLHAQVAAERAAHQSLILTQNQFRLGGVSYLTLLTAQQQYQQAHINRVQAEGTRYSDTVALFQALGGGWWNRNACCRQEVLCKIS